MLSDKCREVIGWDKGAFASHWEANPINMLRKSEMQISNLENILGTLLKRRKLWDGGKQTVDIILDLIIK